MKWLTTGRQARLRIRLNKRSSHHSLQRSITDPKRWPRASRESRIVSKLCKLRNSKSWKNLKQWLIIRQHLRLTTIIMVVELDLKHRTLFCLQGLIIIYRQFPVPRMSNNRPHQDNPVPPGQTHAK